MGARKKKSSTQCRTSHESVRDKTLRILKMRGEMTVLELTRALKLAPTAVRRHLSKLQQDGLLTSVPHQRLRGRPVNKYRLTEKASKEWFPTGYEELVDRMLDSLYEESGHKAVFEFLMAANWSLIRSLGSKLSGTTLYERVQFLVSYFRKNGYLTDFRVLKDGSYFLYHQNCAIYNVASKYRQLCFVELRLIEALAGSKVKRQQYIFKNQPICGYQIDDDAETKCELTI